MTWSKTTSAVKFFAQLPSQSLVQVTEVYRWTACEELEASEQSVLVLTLLLTCVWCFEKHFLVLYYVSVNCQLQ